MDWSRDLQDWPGSAHSAQVDCPPHRWHVQDTGTGPMLLLLHGAGASTHSWRGLMPILAREYRVAAIDLPGQGFTRLGARNRTGLPEMTEDIARLCAQQGWRPQALVGHSAGACIALSLAFTLTDPQGRPPAVIGLNAALGRFEGVAGWLFPLLARLLALNPLTALLFSAGPNPAGRAKRLIEGTGSRLDARGLDLYARLLSDRGHVDGTLKMMARWEIGPLLESLPQIPSRTLLLSGTGDRAVPSRVSAAAAGRIPGATHVAIPGAGHLMHEEDPDDFATRIRAWMKEN